MRRSPIVALICSILFATSFTVDKAEAGDRPEVESVRGFARTSDLVTTINFDKNEIYLLEQNEKAFRVVKEIKVPQRVYLKKTGTTKKFQHFLTDKRGKLETPPAYLLSGSVVRGDRLGGKKERFYVLTADGKWRRSEGPELYNVQDDDHLGARHIMVPNEEDDIPAQVATTPTHAFPTN